MNTAFVEINENMKPPSELSRGVFNLTISITIAGLASEASRAIGMFFINMILFILLIHFYYSILELSTTTTTSSHLNMSVHSHLNGLHLTSTHPTSTTNGHLNTSSHSSARGNFFYFCFFLISLITASYRIYMNHYLHSTPTGKKGQRQHRHDNGEWGAWQGRDHGGSRGIKPLRQVYVFIMSGQRSTPV